MTEFTVEARCECGNKKIQKFRLVPVEEHDQVTRLLALAVAHGWDDEESRQYLRERGLLIDRLKAEVAELKDVLRCGRHLFDRLLQPTQVPIGEHFVTHDMALDAGEPAMEGMSMGVEYGVGDPEDIQSVGPDIVKWLDDLRERGLLEE